MTQLKCSGMLEALQIMQVKGKEIEIEREREGEEGKMNVRSLTCLTGGLSYSVSLYGPAQSLCGPLPEGDRESLSKDILRSAPCGLGPAGEGREREERGERGKEKEEGGRKTGVTLKLFLKLFFP